MVSVSVLLPVHGNPRFLEQSIRSVIEQTLEDFELIIVTDRASATAHKTIDDLASKDNRLIKMQSNGEGLSRALNTGLEIVSSPYICRLDDDDMMFKDRLFVQKSFMDKNASVVCLGSQVAYFGETKKVSFSRLPTEDWQIRAEAIFFNPLAHPALMIRREVLERLSGYSDAFRYAQDYELLSRLLEEGRIKNLTKPLTAYRVHKNQSTRVASQRQRAPYELAAIAGVIESTKLKSVSEERLEIYLQCPTPELCFLQDLSSDFHIARAAVILRSAKQSGGILKALGSIISSIRVAPARTLLFLFSKSISLVKSMLYLALAPMVLSQIKKDKVHSVWLTNLNHS